MGLMFHHTHRQEVANRRRKHNSKLETGRQSVAFSFGCLANISGAVPSFGNAVDTDNKVVRHQENWINGVGIVEYEDGGSHAFRHQFIHIDDTDGHKAWLNDKEYTPAGIKAAGYSYKFGEELTLPEV